MLLRLRLSFLLNISNANALDHWCNLLCIRYFTPWYSMDQSTHDTLIHDDASFCTCLSMLIAAGKSHTVAAVVEASEGHIRTAFVVTKAFISVSSWPGCILTALGYNKGEINLMHDRMYAHTTQHNQFVSQLELTTLSTPSIALIAAANFTCHFNTNCK